jgi:GT2 family glycosyltransferase
MTEAHVPSGTLDVSSATTEVSVIVPTHERRASVLRLCDALSRQSVAPTLFELVVSIDGSSDGTREALQERAFPYRVKALWHPRGGRAAALNAGVAAAAGSLLILLDDDMEPAPAFIEAHRRAHADGARHGVMGAAPLLVGAEATPAARYLASRFNGHLRNLARPDYQRRLTDFYSGNFSIRRDLLLEVSGFDEDFREYGNEDLELSHRLARAGVRVSYSPDALARQHNDKSFADLTRDRVAEGRTAVLFASKHPDVFDELKLGTFHDGPRVLRAIRDTLLAIGRRWSGLPDALQGLERVLARARLPGVSVFYRLALGYFYWTGVAAQLRENGRSSTSGERLRRLAIELHT